MAEVPVDGLMLLKSSQRASSWENAIGIIGFGHVDTILLL